MRKIQTQDSAFQFLTYVAISILTYQVVAEIANDTASFQWDFKRYYFAGKLSLLGEDPYDFGKMISLFGDRLPLQMPFLYPPYSIILFRPLSRLTLENAYYLFLSLKLIAYMLLFTTWKRLFFKEASTSYFLLFAFLSMGAEGVVSDLYAGNIAVFQQLLFWLGIALLMNKKVIASGLCVVLASSVKYFVFAPLLLIYAAAGYWRHFILFVSALATLIASVFVHSPTYFEAVVRNNIQHVALHETGHSAISIRNILLDYSLYHKMIIPPDILYGIIVIVVLVSSSYIIKTNISFLRKNNILLVHFIIVSSCIVVPLLKDYEQVIIIPSTFYLFHYFQKKEQYSTMYCLFLLYFLFTDRTVMFLGKLTGIDFQCNMQSILYFIMNYHVLFALLVTWIMYFYIVKKESMNC